MKTFLLATTFIVGFHIWALHGAQAHDAPSGWSYDPRCCNTMDCRPADGPTGPRHHPMQIVETPKGYLVKHPDPKYDELIEFGSKKIRPSQDGDWHVCTHGGSDIGGTICIYVPNKAT